MRCPKCGYISFDHLEECVKCKKNIKAASDTMHGTVFSVAAPAFLHFDLDGGEQEGDEVAVAEAPLLEDDFIDDDLEVLVDDGERDDTDAPVAVAKSVGKDDADDEDREIEIDLSQFEDAEEFEGAGDVAEKPKKDDELSLSLDLPEELNDLSDLAPPARPAAVKSAAKPADDDMEIETLDFDLGLGDAEEEPAVAGGAPRETVLALDDIDFSGPLAKKDAAKRNAKAPSAGADMDEDLNFELDLGGLSLHKDL